MSSWLQVVYTNICALQGGLETMSLTTEGKAFFPTLAEKGAFVSCSPFTSK
jgi:hypothetical protein